MKKYQLFALAIAICTLFQSCSITSEITYHKDATSSMLMNVNMKEAMVLIKSMGQDSNANATTDFSNYSKNWESLYDSAKKKALEKGEKFSPAADTAKVMKKFFTKMIVDENGEMEGASVKFDRLTNAELKILSDQNSKEAEPMSAANIGDWNGKTLVLDMSKLNAEMLNKNGNIQGGDDAENSESLNQMVKMFKMTFLNTIKLEQKIKSIIGKHDWLTQKDNHTLILAVDLAQLTDKEVKLKNKDSKIIITTE